MRPLRQLPNHNKQALYLWFALVASACILATLTAIADIDFRFVRKAILSGEYWRIISGHLSHASTNHLLLNAAFLGLLLYLFSVLKNLKFGLLVWLASCILISLAMLSFSPNLHWYVGLSASLYALLAVGICFERSYKLWFKALLLGAIALKIGLEQNQTTNPVADFIAAPVAEISHLYGYITGLIIALALAAYSWIVKRH